MFTYRINYVCVTICRLLFVLVSLIVVAHFHVVDLSNPLSEELVTSRGENVFYKLISRLYKSKTIVYLCIAAPHYVLLLNFRVICYWGFDNPRVVGSTSSLCLFSSLAMVTETDNMGKTYDKLCHRSRQN